MRNVLSYIAPLLVAIAAYCTYAIDYAEPASFFWDENYHVTAAQKYINEIFFMEPHAPLGKILIAVGEKIVHSNAIDNQFVDTDYAKNTPDGFSFKGYRTVPVLCAWLVAIALYATFLEITGKPLWAMMLSSLYVFDNALIVHSRGAMLDGIQLLFIVVTFLLTLRVRNGHRDLLTMSLLGIMFGAGVASKENGILLAPALLIPLWSFPRSATLYLKYLATVTVFSLVTFIGVWWGALALSNNINPKLENKGWYNASPELKSAILEHSRSPRTLYYFIRDSLGYAEHYHSRVPQLNYCHIDENGSYPLFWPLGARAINYRWQKKNDLVQYLYLQVNPAVWLIALLSIVFSAALCFTRILGQRRNPLPHEDVLITLVALYVIYFGAVLSVNRVFYLYHYFVPLLYCFLLCAILITDLGSDLILRASEAKRLVVIKSELLFVLMSASLSCFWFFAPFTYYWPINAAQFKRHEWLQLWDLTWLSDPREDPIARAETKVGKDQRITSPDIFISGVRASSLYQQWGEAHQNLTIDGKPIVVAGVTYPSGLGVHATSIIDFPVGKNFVHFSALVGIPDEVLDSVASVRFSVKADGKEIWNSGTVVPGTKAIPLELDIKDISTLSLLVAGTKGEKEVDFDHACWLSPRLLPKDPAAAALSAVPQSTAVH